MEALEPPQTNRANPCSDRASGLTTSAATVGPKPPIRKRGRTAGESTVATPLVHRAARATQQVQVIANAMMRYRAMWRPSVMASSMGYSWSLRNSRIILAKPPKSRRTCSLSLST